LCRRRSRAGSIRPGRRTGKSAGRCRRSNRSTFALRNGGRRPRIGHRNHNQAHTRVRSRSRVRTGSRTPARSRNPLHSSENDDGLGACPTGRRDHIHTPATPISIGERTRRAI
jgi:hypothetical protein